MPIEKVKIKGFIIFSDVEIELCRGIQAVWPAMAVIMNESIAKDTVVLLDEPENSINPRNIPALVEVMLDLHRHGVQVIAATHSYNFARYFDVLRKNGDAVKHLCLYKADDGSTIISWAESFKDLLPNSIDEAGERLYKDAISKAID